MINKTLCLTLSIFITSNCYAVPALVCFGDSVTKAQPYVQQGEGYCDQVNGINAGQGGNTTEQGLERFKRDVLSHNPRTIVIMFGLNDAFLGVSVKQFKSNLNRMIKLAGNRKVILMTPNPYHSDKELNAQLEPYAKAVRQIAQNRKLKLVDNYQAFAELGLKDYLDFYYADALHPNAQGQQLITNNLRRYL